MFWDYLTFRRKFFSVFELSIFFQLPFACFLVSWIKKDPMCGSEKKIVTNSAFLRRKRIWDEKKGRFLVFLYNASIQGVSYCNGRNEMALRDTRVTNFVESWCLMTVQKEHEPNRARTKKGTNQKQHQPNRARTKKSTN